MLEHRGRGGPSRRCQLSGALPWDRFYLRKFPFAQIVFISESFVDLFIMYVCMFVCMYVRSHGRSPGFRQLRARIFQPRGGYVAPWPGWGWAASPPPPFPRPGLVWTRGLGAATLEVEFGSRLLPKVQKGGVVARVSRPREGRGVRIVSYFVPRRRLRCPLPPAVRREWGRAGPAGMQRSAAGNQGVVLVKRELWPRERWPGLDGPFDGAWCFPPLSLTAGLGQAGGSHFVALVRS